MNNDTSFDIIQESNPVQTVAPTNKEYIGELDRLFIRSYEDNVSGKIDDERFAMMNKSYTQEQKDLKAEVISLQQVIEEQERQAENLEQFIQRVKRNSELTELTPYALRELVKAVYVEAPDKSSGKRKQKIHISYDLIGFIPVDVLTKSRTGMTEIMPVPRKIVNYFFTSREPWLTPFRSGRSCAEFPQCPSPKELSAW